MPMMCFAKLELSRFSSHVFLLFQSIEKEAKEEVEAAVQAAQSDPDPTLDDLFLDVYADDNMEGHQIRGCDNWSRHATNWLQDIFTLK